jgi:hypothetical protein
MLRKKVLQQLSKYLGSELLNKQQGGRPIGLAPIFDSGFSNLL